MKIINQVKKLRLKRNITQEQLAVEVKVSYTDKIEAMDPICLNGDLDNITQ